MENKKKQQICLKLSMGNQCSQELNKNSGKKGHASRLLEARLECKS